MRKPLLCSLTLLFFSISSVAQSLQDLEWQDEALQECVEKAARNNQWTRIVEVTALKCHKAGIINAQKLSEFVGLKSLSLYSNKITELDLRQLQDLEFLNLANNKLKELKINGLGKLHTVYLFRNKLKTVDLSGLSSVQKIRLMQNGMTELDITPLKSLETGYFFDNELEDLQITGLAKLTFLDVKQNPMPDELYDFYDEQEGVVISHDGNADDWQ